MGEIGAQMPWDAQEVVPAAKVPQLPWCPAFEDSTAKSRRWILTLGSWPLAIVYLEASATPWWLMLGTLFFLWPLYDELRGPCNRLTVTAEGFEIRGVLRKRTFSWSAIEVIQLRRYEVSADLGRYGRQTWRFDGQQGRPSAVEVASVLERLRLSNRSMVPRRRRTPSWGAVVLLAGTVVSISAAVAGLLVGTR